MRIFYDTEFLDRGHAHPLHLISVGMVRADGAELYAINADMDQHAVRTHPWLSENVWPHLPLVAPRPGTRGGSHPRLDLDHPDVRPRAQLARAVADFVLSVPDPQLWAWFSAHDHVALTQLFGPMVDLPQGFPMRTNDLRQTIDLLPDAERAHMLRTLPERHGAVHHALDDARTLAAWFDHVEEQRRVR